MSIITDPVHKVLDEVDETGLLCFDIEHDGDLKPGHANFEIHRCGFRSGTVEDYITDRDVISEIVCTVFARDDVEVIAYNGKYDLLCLLSDNIVTVEQIPEHTFRDPMVAINLLDDNRRPGAIGLKAVVKDLYGVNLPGYKEATLTGLDSPVFRKYALNDVHYEYKLWEYVKPKLKDQDLWDLFVKILMPVSCVFAEMELMGVGWDISSARRLLTGFQKLRDQMEEGILSEIGLLNINSGDQLAKRLFKELGYNTKGIQHTASGNRLAVDEKAMDILAKRYPVCDKIRTYRTANKMINTYVEPLTTMALADTNSRIHPTFWIVSSTGRTRCQNPNFQNIPAWLHKRAKFSELNIRKNIVPSPGYKLIVADLSQIELRMMAHITGDVLFFKAYNSWQCKKCGDFGSHTTILHHYPSCGVFEDEDNGFWHGADLHQQTFDLVPATGDRQGAKTANFMLIYLGGAWRAHQEYPDLSVDQWQEVIDQYFGPDAYIEVHRWHVKMEAVLRSTGVCTDVFGRKRRIRQADVIKNYKHCLNQFVNFPAQSSACALMELSMVNMRRHYIKTKK